MNVCGYCNNEYNDTEPKCPVCGSTLLKYDKHSNSAEAELKRIRDEVERKRASRSTIIGIGIAVIILAVIIAIISITSYVTDPQREIDKEANELLSQSKQQINDGNYDDAIDTINKINPEWDDYSKVEDQRTEAVREQLAATIAEYQASGDYASVITFISENVSDVNSDPEIKKIYDDAVAQYKTVALNKADEYVSAGDYSAATSVLTTALRVIGDDGDINNKLLSINRSEIYATALEYKNNGDYASAITYINDHMDVVGSDSDVLLVLSDCENAYRQAVISNAATAYQSNGYQSALAEINAGLAVMPNDSELLNEQAAYLACEPISLFSLEPYTYTGYPSHLTDIADTLGNVYNNAWTDQSWMYDEGGSSVTYNIDRQYNILTGTVVVAKEDKGQSYVACIRIFGDGILLFENMNITSDTKPIKVEIDITNVSDLKIELISCGVFGMTPRAVQAIICDVTLEKTR